ncbi:MAG: aminoglycoside phosphotransferase family protein, partial [Bacteroidetes bacterium]|nr:aminoglycoside phosphotransferase family protein [Bacteroidota bacterium]
MTDLLRIANEFNIEGKPSGFVSIDSGHINDSYRIRISPEGSQEYMLQKINHHVFTDVPGLTDNILKVTKHISENIRTLDAGISFVELFLIPTRNNSFVHHDGDGNFWRMFNFIDDSRSFDQVPGPELAFEGGRAFGLFLKLTKGMDASGLAETLKDFHNIETRLEAFRSICAENPCKRVAKAGCEIRFIEERAEEMHSILRLGRSGQIPLRVTHNDTKFNNILFNSQNKAICIVDLDTVMPGYSLYDFGDAIRTGANAGAEDEADLQKVFIDLDLFSAYSKGFLEYAGEILTLAEKEHLAFSARFMTFIIGLRFLT